MDFSTKYHEPLAVDEEALLVEGHDILQEVSVVDLEQIVGSTLKGKGVTALKSQGGKCEETG